VFTKRKLIRPEACLIGRSETLRPTGEVNAFANDANEYPVYESENQYDHQKQAYETLDADPALTASEVPLQEFYDSVSVAAMGALMEVDQAILDKDYINASSLNNSVVPSNVMEENQQVFNTLYLAGLSDSNYVYSQNEKDILYGIAEQCPLEGGNAVWQARALIWSIESYPVEFTDACMSSEKRNMSITEEVNSSSVKQINNFKLYPNPSKGEMTLEYNLNENETGVLSLYDVTGKSLEQIVLNSKFHKVVLNETALEAGVYYYNILVNNKPVQTQKLIIIK
jgi:hypothetical protein